MFTFNCLLHGLANGKDGSLSRERALRKAFSQIHTHTLTTTEQVQVNYALELVLPATQFANPF